MSVFLTLSAARAHRRGAHWHWLAPHRSFAAPGSACGDHRLAADSARDPAVVPHPDRCSGRGCAERWVAVDQPADLMTETEEART